MNLQPDLFSFAYVPSWYIFEWLVRERDIMVERLEAEGLKTRETVKKKPLTKE